MTDRARITPLRTAKMLIGGKHVRSESGHVYQVTGADGSFPANVPAGSRKDARDAVTAARSALAGWSGTTAYNRGQVLFRIAEMTEGRSSQLAAEVVAVEGITHAEALEKVHATVDRIVWYAGWADKIGQVTSSVNPVAGSFSSVSETVPAGVAVVVAPASSLLGLVSVTLPYLTAGCTVVVLAAPDAPLPAVTFAEILATSDVPAGVVNILTGPRPAMLPSLAGHRDVDVLDLAGVTDPVQAVDAETTAAQTLTRVRQPVTTDWAATPGLGRLRAALETRTVWATIGK